ncbi:MAG: hypothetical protein QM736_08720 [Vicinamibacterales bacterium]
MRDGGLGQAEDIGDVTHAKLTTGECVQNPHACRVAQHLEGVDEPCHELRVE